ncbi:nucleotide exchange factor GrpE [Isosphaeraceae bacterium EP7]
MTPMDDDLIEVDGPDEAEGVDVSLVVPPEIVDSVDTDEGGWAGEVSQVEASIAVVPDLPAVAAQIPENPAIRELGESLTGRLDKLQSLFEREVRAEATRERVVDRLHAELQEYKNDLLLKVLRPVFVDLIQLHDDIGKIAEAQPDGQGPEVARLLGLMRGFQQGIEDILYRQGVEPFEVDGDEFDPRRQRAVATTATDDPGLNRRVASRHRRGFKSEDRMIRPEVVSVFAHRPGSD